MSLLARTLFLATLCLGLGVAQPAHAAVTSFRCTVADVAVFTDAKRVHVKCNEGQAGIFYYAVATTDGAEAQRVLSLATAALLAKQPVLIRYDPAVKTGLPPGCADKDCRTLLSLALLAN